MSTYRCDAGHRTERLTACTGWRHRVLLIHELPGGRGWEACTCGCPDDGSIRCPCRVCPCHCGKEADEEITCPATLGRAAADALILPATCGKPARIVRCVACGREASLDFCDDCWSDLQGGYQE